jgi:hypothetical protein
MSYNPEEAKQIIHSLLRAAGVSEQQIRHAEARARREHEDWLKKQDEEAKQRDEATKQHTIQLDVNSTMVYAGAELERDELLRNKSSDYKVGFLDGQIFESELRLHLADLDKGGSAYDIMH